MADNETNKQVVMQYVEAFNQGDLELLQGLFTPDALIQGVLVVAYQMHTKCIPTVERLSVERLSVEV